MLFTPVVKTNRALTIDVSSLGGHQSGKGMDCAQDERGRGVPSPRLSPKTGEGEEGGLFDAGGGDAWGGVDYGCAGEDVVEAAVVASEGHCEQGNGKKRGIFYDFSQESAGPSDS